MVNTGAVVRWIAGVALLVYAVVALWAIRETASLRALAIS